MITSISGILAINRFSDPTSNVFLGTVSNLWSTATNWSLGVLPTANQIAIIEADCLMNANYYSSATNSVKELRINSGKIFSYSGSGTQYFNVGSLVNFGTINCKTAGAVLNITGLNHVFGNIDFANQGTINFLMNADFDLPELDYCHVNRLSRIHGSLPENTYKRSLIANTIIRGNIGINGFNFALGDYNLEVFGELNTDYGILTKTGPGSIIIHGNMHDVSGTVNLSGNPDIEVKGSLWFGCYSFNFGTGNLRLTTNNKTLYSGFSRNRVFNNNIIIDGITVTIPALGIQNTTAPISFNNINGTDSNSILNVQGTVQFYADGNIMTIGKLICNTNSTIKYLRTSGNQYIKTPDNGFYWNLDFNDGNTNNGNKHLENDLFIKGYLLGCHGSGSPRIYTYNYNLTVDGYCYLPGGSTIYKTTSVGKLRFNGLLQPTTGNLQLSNGAIVECLGGISTAYAVKNWNDSIFKFLNTQTINAGIAINFGLIEFSEDVEITISNSSTATVNFNNSISTQTNNKLINNKVIQFNTETVNENLSLINGNDSIVIYARNGSQDIIIANYNELRLINSGIKTLNGNISCTHLYFSGTATLNENGYIVAAYTKFTDIGTVNRTISTTVELAELNLTGSGTKTLLNNITTSVLNYNSNARIDLNSNSLISTNINWVVSQSVLPINLIPLPNKIYNSITLSYTGSGNKIILQEDLTVNTMIMNGSTQSNQFFINENGFNIICDDWRYTSNETQYMYGRTYPNLIIGGSGNKTLLGNIIVTGSYSKVGTSIINKNGFTIKDSDGNELV